MSGKRGIPSWQRAHSTASSSTPAEPNTSPDPETSPEQPPESSPAPGAEETAAEDGQPQGAEDGQPQETQDPSLLDQASKFLEDDTVRDAPREKKVAFLESKGVPAEHIEQLLGHDIAEDATPDITEAGERAWSTAPSKPAQPPQPRSQPRDIPPIVTYPEFLAQPTQPPPLITTRRLLNTAYIAGGLAATIYGLSKYIVGPMAQNLTESRHDFASHTQEHLDKLNERLKDVVSVDPAAKSKSKISDVADDISEADSDPTELFHRDYGTQTSPSLSRRPSQSTSTEDQSTVTAHENRLKILASHLHELDATQNNDTASRESLKTRLSDLATYLHEMSYQTSWYGGPPALVSVNYGLPKTKEGKDDQIEVLKSDIRAVKGVFLSSRNFPAGARDVAPTGRVGG